MIHEYLLHDPVLALAIRTIAHPLGEAAEAAGQRGDRITKSRLLIFLDWIQTQPGLWMLPDLPAYAAYLAGQDKRPGTIRAYIATVRSFYEKLIQSNWFRDTLYQVLPPDTPAERRLAYALELEARVSRVLNQKIPQTQTTRSQDVPDRRHRRLTPQEVAQLLAAPGVENLRGLRDTTMIALMLCTGVRSAELMALNVEDLHATLDGYLALHVRQGKGNKERLVPYGHLQWGLDLTEAWLRASGISSGPVFGKLTRYGRIARRANGYAIRLKPSILGQILRDYPIVIDGRAMQIRPHDLRRTYARVLYDAGMPKDALRLNLGHISADTTNRYIGPINVGQRLPPAAYGEQVAAGLLTYLTVSHVTFLSLPTQPTASQE